MIGEDRDLLQTRGEVLSYFWSVSTSHAAELNDLEPEGADLVVLCHSIAESKRLELLDQLAMRQPKPLVVLLEAPHAYITAPCDRVVDTSKGPALLVSTIYGLLEEHGLSSKSWMESQLPYFK